MASEIFAHSVAANLSYWFERARPWGDETLHALDPERHNLLRAVQFGLGLESTRGEAANLMLQIYPLIERRGYWRRWIPLLENALAKCSPEDHELAVHLLDRLGQCYRLDRQWAKSLERHRQEEDLAQQLGDGRLLAKAQLNLSQTYWSEREYDKAEVLAEQALEGFEQAGGEPEQFGAARSNLGLIALGCGDLERAESWLREAIAIYRSIERPALLARSLMNLMITLERAGRIEEALVCGHEALSLLAGTEHELDKVRVELTIGTLYMDLEQWAEAEKAYKRADSLALRQSGNAYLMALAANNLGSVYMQMGRLQESELVLRRSIDYARQSGGRVMLANSLGSMAETKLAMHARQEAIPYLDQAIAIAAEFPNDGWARAIVERYTELRAANC